MYTYSRPVVLTPTFRQCGVPVAVVDRLVRMTYMHGGSQVLMFCFMICAVVLLGMHEALASSGPTNALAVSLLISWCCSLYFVYAALRVAYPTYVRKVYVEAYIALRDASAGTLHDQDGAQPAHSPNQHPASPCAHPDHQPCPGQDGSPTAGANTLA